MFNQGTNNGDNIRVTMRRMVQVITELRTYDPQMELSQALCYFLIAANPGIRVADLLKTTELSRSALSRNVLTLSKRHYDNTKPGLDLVTTASDPFDGRAQLASTTQKGAALAAKLTSILTGTGGQQEQHQTH